MKRFGITVDEQGHCFIRVDERIIGLVQGVSFSLTTSTSPSIVVVFPEVMKNPTEERIQDAVGELASVRELESKSPLLAKPARNGAPNTPADVQVVYVAHSIPLSMADTSDYVKQLEEVRRLASEAVGVSNDALVYQSRSGAPGQPWLEPDILDYLREVNEKDLASAVVIAPISFISDHMEVLYDLDIEARHLCEELQLPMARAKTVGVHPKFIAMIRELILERTEGAERRSLGTLGAREDVCAEDCCPAPQRPMKKLDR